MATDAATFTRDRHRKFLKRALAVLPSDYANLDQNRITMAYFAVQGLDVLNSLDDVNRKEIIDWVYAMQVLPDKDDPSKNSHLIGFRGGSSLGAKYNPGCETCNCYLYDQGHVTHTYTALALLRICGDDFSKLNKSAIIASLRGLQREDGSFTPIHGDAESDMRFLYSAAVVAYLLNDFSGFDVDKAVAYIKSSQAYDFGIAQAPFQESHAGSTYCAIAAMYLMGRERDIPNRDGLIQWLLERQQVGFQGRTNKKCDTCYSWWVGATLSLLGVYHLVDIDSNQSYSMKCQQEIGGFAKWPDSNPDPLHTCLGIQGLSLMGYPDLARVEPALGITTRAAGELAPSVGRA